MWEAKRKLLVLECYRSGIEKGKEPETPGSSGVSPDTTGTPGSSATPLPATPLPATPLVALATSLGRPATGMAPPPPKRRRQSYTLKKSFTNDEYSSFLQEIKEKNKDIINFFQTLYGEMKCFLKEPIKKGAIDNSERQKGHFLDAKFNEPTIGEGLYLISMEINDEITSSIKIEKFQEEPQDEHDKEYKWIKFVYKEEKVTVPWLDDETENCVEITLTDIDGYKVAYLEDFMFKHSNCKCSSNIKPRHIMDAIKSFLYKLNVRYIHLSDATSYVLKIDDRTKCVNEIEIPRRVMQLIKNKTTVYSNYGFLPKLSNKLKIPKKGEEGDEFLNIIWKDEDFSIKYMVSKNNDEREIDSLKEILNILDDVAKENAKTYKYESEETVTQVLEKMHQEFKEFVRQQRQENA